MNGVADKCVIVTGGAGGLGRAYCTRLVEDGARVVVADIDGDAAKALADELDGANGRRAIGVRVDVTSPSETEAMVQAAISAFGRLDVLLNNAGSYPHTPFEELTYDEWREIIAINLDSAFLCSKAVFEHMRGRGGGKIINVATNLVWSGLAEMAHYVAAKSGVVGLTRSLARELGRYGITVNALAPGAVVPAGPVADAVRERIDMVIRYQCIQRGERPEDLVGAVLFLVSDESNFISGQVITVDGGLTTH